METVDSEEDMIADLAAMLVSKKEKIAKELLDLECFDDVIERFMKLPDVDYKKSGGFGSSSKENSNRQSSMISTTTNKESREHGLNISNNMGR